MMFSDDDWTDSGIIQAIDSPKHSHKYRSVNDMPARVKEEKNEASRILVSMLKVGNPRKKMVIRRRMDCYNWMTWFTLESLLTIWIRWETLLLEDVCSCLSYGQGSEWMVSYGSRGLL